MKYQTRWLCQLAAALVVSCVLTSPVLAQTVRYYGASTTPASVVAGTSNNHSITIENCNGSVLCAGFSTTSSQKVQSARIVVPAGFTVSVPSLSVSATGGKLWTAVWNVGLNSIDLVKVASDQLAVGESVTVSFTATAACVAGDYTWTTSAFNGADFSTGYVIKSAQPLTAVTGNCVVTGFAFGDYCSIGQGGWGAAPNGGNPGAVLSANFDSLYSDLVVGGSNDMTFNAAADVIAYLPAGSTPGGLSGDLLNPTSSPSGVFGGQVTALALNVDFNDAGITDGLEGSFSGLVLQGTGTSLDGATVTEILVAAEAALGGDGLPAGLTFSGLNDLVTNLNEAFENCDPSEWAITHLSVE